MTTGSATRPLDAQTLTLKDGRILGYAIYGSPSTTSTAPTIFYLHGFPGARIEGALWLGSSFSPALNAQLIGVDRPGMGLSTFQPSRRILDFPIDLIELADHLKIEKFHILGGSGGVPYALACTKDIPKTRLINTTLVSGFYPGSREGMLFALRALMFVGYWAPTSLMASIFDMKFGRAARNPDPKVMEDLFMAEMQGRPEKDLQCLENEEVRKSLTRSLSEAFAGEGGMGVAWDWRLYSDWGFELTDVDGKDVAIWHGKADVNTPILMAEEASKLLTGCTFHAFDNETHMSLPFNHVEKILNDLLKLK